MVGRRMFSLRLAQYIVFLLSITLFTLSKLDYDNFKEHFQSNNNTLDPAANNNTLDPAARASLNLSVSANLQTINCFNSVDCWIDHFSGDIAMAALRSIITVTIGLGIMLEVSQMVRMKGRYFDLGNLIDWTIFLTSLVLVLDEVIWDIKIVDISKGCAAAKVVFNQAHSLP